MPTWLGVEGFLRWPGWRGESGEAGRGMGCAVPTASGSPGGDTSPCRAGSENPIGSCQEKPLQNVLPTLLRAGGFRSAVAPLSAAGRVSLSRQGCPWAGDGACAVASWCCHFPGDALGLGRQGQTLDLLSGASAQALGGFSAEQAVSAWPCHRARTTRAPLSPCAPQSMSHPRTCPSSAAKREWPQSTNPVGTAELWTDEQVGFLCILFYFIFIFSPKYPVPMGPAGVAVSNCLSLCFQTKATPARRCLKQLCPPPYVRL